MERDAVVVVVGAGIVGCAAASFPTRRDARRVAVERGPVPGEQARKNRRFVRHQGRDSLELPLLMDANRPRRGLERGPGADLEWGQGGTLALAADEKRLAPAELIVDGKPSLDIAGFRFRRFAEGAVGPPRNVL